MIRKIVSGFAAVILVSGVAFASVGIETKFGFIGEDSNYDKMDDVNIANGSKDYSDNSVSWNINVFFEKNNMFNIGKKSSLGVKAGYTGYGESSFKAVNYTGNAKLTSESNAYSIPVSVYYKYDFNRKWKFYGGVGAAFLSNTFTDKKTDAYGQNTSMDEETTVTAVMPTVEIGAEFALSKVVSLFMDIGGQFNGKTETKYIEFVDLQTGKTERLYRDFSGFTTNFGVKIYIF